ADETMASNGSNPNAHRVGIRKHSRVSPGKEVLLDNRGACPRANKPSLQIPRASRQRWTPRSRMYMKAAAGYHGV
ncbi:MAG: hypothetical protein P4L26_16120, partial [Terracidiphilus sp.]|nr:hypothetical protein [Terracidiphilus sp.]